MKENTIYCIGSVLWDIIGKCPDPMHAGDDKGGTITRLPGGVALNIAMNLRNLDVAVGLVSVIGNDFEGDELIRALERYAFQLDHVLRDDLLPTDAYMAIETPNGPLAAIADANSLEAVGTRVLAPFMDGRLGADSTPYQGNIVVDGNLTVEVLAEIGALPCFSDSSLWVAPASPGKATRLRCLLGHANATFFVNRAEAELIMDQEFADSRSAAIALRDTGLLRAIVTNSADDATVATSVGIYSATPPDVVIKRYTGAGDSFMAAFIAAKSKKHSDNRALDMALNHTAAYISADDNVFAV